MNRISDAIQREKCLYCGDEAAARVWVGHGATAALGRDNNCVPIQGVAATFHARASPAQHLPRGPVPSGIGNCLRCRFSCIAGWWSAQLEPPASWRYSRCEARCAQRAVCAARQPAAEVSAQLPALQQPQGQPQNDSLCVVSDERIHVSVCLRHCCDQYTVEHIRSGSCWDAKVLVILLREPFDEMNASPEVNAPRHLKNGRNSWDIASCSELELRYRAKRARGTLGGPVLTACVGHSHLAAFKTAQGAASQNSRTRIYFSLVELVVRRCEASTR